MDDYNELVSSLREGGFIKDKVKIDPQKLKDYLGPFVEPTEVDEFHFTRKWMRRQFNRINDPKGDAFSVMTRLNLPPEYLLIHRTWTGGVGVLSQLEARVRFRELLTQTPTQTDRTHQYSLSSLPSMARRFSREQASQK